MNEKIDKEMMEGSPRYVRAKQFADTILRLMSDFVPTDRLTWRRMHDFLLEQAFDANGAIITVPPEYDKLTAAQIEMAMLEKAMKPIVFLSPEPSDR